MNEDSNADSARNEQPMSDEQPLTDQSASDLPPLHTNQPLFSISVVSEMVCSHAQTIRTWEVKGLLSPHRTPGGTRRYSLHDITRIRTIQNLSAKGVNLEGIRQILNLRSQLDDIRAQAMTAARARFPSIPPSESTD